MKPSGRLLLLLLQTDTKTHWVNLSVAQSDITAVSIHVVLPEVKLFLGCFGAVYWKDSFPRLPSWSSPNSEASLALQHKGHDHSHKLLLHEMYEPLFGYARSEETHHGPQV